jgi:hypothetical protein
MSGVGISGLIANLPATVTPYPTQDPGLELGGFRSVANAAARDAIPANFRSIGMKVTLQDTGSEYELVGGILNANWILTSNGELSFITRSTLADLTARDSASLPNGCVAYVVSEREQYQLDTLNPLTTFSPLIVARGAGTGKWYRRSRAFVVANYTLWGQSFGFGAVGFTPGQLLVTGTVTPDIMLNLGPLHPSTGQQDVLIDAVGNVWIGANNGTYTGTVIRKYLLKDCLVSGSPVAALTLTPPATGTEAGNIVFDRFGNLWSANGTHAAGGLASFLKFGSRNYSQSNGVPCLTLTAGPGGATFYSNQQDFLFDPDGNLWFSYGFDSASAVSGIAMFTAAQVAVGGASVSPAVVWSGANFAPILGGAENLAIAPNGLLWATKFAGGSALKAWPMVGAVSGNPAPTITITSASFSSVYGLTFDRDGNLWTCNAANNRLMRFPAASIAVSGAVVPDVIITPGGGATLFSRIRVPNDPERCPLPAGFP